MNKEPLDELKRYFFTEDKQIKVVSVDSEFVDELGIKTAGFVRFEDIKEMLKDYIPKSMIDDLINKFDRFICRQICGEGFKECFDRDTLCREGLVYKKLQKLRDE